jgi:hypothetical protein
MLVQSLDDRLLSIDCTPGLPTNSLQVDALNWPIVMPARL